MARAASKRILRTPAEEVSNPGFGRPRSPAAHQAMLDAACEIFAAGGPGALNVQAICERAGSSRATFYRRWATVWECYAEAIDVMISSPLVLDANSDVLEALIETVMNTYQTLSNPAYRSSFGIYLMDPGEGSDQFLSVKKGIDQRRGKILEMMEQAVKHGHLKLYVPADALLNISNGLALNAALLDRKLTVEDVRNTIARLVDRL